MTGEFDSERISKIGQYLINLLRDRNWMAVYDSRSF